MKCNHVLPVDYHVSMLVLHSVGYDECELPLLVLHRQNLTEVSVAKIIAIQ